MPLSPVNHAFVRAGGSLFTFVQKRGRLQEQDARWFFQQLCMTLDFCHQRNVSPVHWRKPSTGSTPMKSTATASPGKSALEACESC